nr:VacJ family lipoprotein [Rhizomicrobium palustre]
MRPIGQVTDPKSRHCAGFVANLFSQGAWVIIQAHNKISALIAVLFCAALGGCASSAPPGEYDPLEPLNRDVFAFNKSLDTRAALPAATYYKSAVPDTVRLGIHNFMSNLSMPVTFANDVLQGEFDNAGYAICRLAVNTTIGIAGFMDRASDMGCHYHDEDFGQTLGVYGVPGGPYLVLPLLGSSLPRDVVGKLVVDGYFNPLGYVKYNGKFYVSLGQNVLKLVDQRSRAVGKLREVERNSVDYYAAMRSLYIQRRNAAIRNDIPSPGTDPVPPAAPLAPDAPTQ